MSARTLLSFKPEDIDAEARRWEAWRFAFIGWLGLAVEECVISDVLLSNSTPRRAYHGQYDHEWCTYLWVMKLHGATLPLGVWLMDDFGTLVQVDNKQTSLCLHYGRA